jgi:hypothetical protein
MWLIDWLYGLCDVWAVWCMGSELFELADWVENINPLLWYVYNAPFHLTLLWTVISHDLIGESKVSTTTLLRSIWDG